jgi:hypothetical protein
MGTNCDENAAAPVAAKTQQQIDRNNSKRLGLRRHSASSFQKYPPLGAAAARIQLPIGQGARIQGGTLYL